MQQQKLCLKWNNHTLNLLSVLETFQQKDILVDVTLSCEGHNIKAHKMILSACSPYFQNIFLENPCQHPIVIINGMKYEDITAILNFMYKGEVNVSHDGLSSFLQAAEALKVKGLAEVCGEKKSPGSGSQEPEQSEQTRPQRTETPTTKRRHRNRKRSLSDSNRSDDEAAPRKHKGSNSPEVHELSGDESYTGDMSSNGQNSRVPQNVYSRSHQSSSNITADEMDDEYEVEPSKMLEQTLTTDNANSASSDNSLRIERIMGNATEMESSNLHEPESPPDIKPIIEYGESSAGPSEGSMMVYNEQSQPGPSNMQDGSLLHDNSHTQGKMDSVQFNNGHTYNETKIGNTHKICGHCKFTAAKLSDLASHIIDHRGQMFAVKYNNVHTDKSQVSDSQILFCGHCKFTTTQRSDLTSHIITHKGKTDSIKFKKSHTDNKDQVNLTRNLECGHCPFTTTYESDLTSHMIAHRDCRQTDTSIKECANQESSYTCYECVYKTPSKDEICKHLHSHSNSIYICERCNTKFYSLNEYRKHLKHKNKSKCKKKGKKNSQKDFKHPSILTKGLTSEVKEMKKETDTCVESSIIPLNNSPKSHMCIKCKENFADIRELCSHRAIAHKPEIYHCDGCSDVFHDMYQLECHRKYNHKK